MTVKWTAIEQKIKLGFCLLHPKRKPAQMKRRHLLITASVLSILIYCSQAVHAQAIHFTAIEQDILIDKLIDKIQSDYIIVDQGEKAIAYLNKVKINKSLAAISDPQTFAATLTDQLRKITADKHLAVFFEPVKLPKEENRKENALKLPGKERYNYGFEKIERLEGNIGLIQINQFANLNEAKSVAEKYMMALKNFDAIIIDLRQNGGGQTPMMAFIANYFFGDTTVHFTDLEWRNNPKLIEVWTDPHVTDKSDGKDLIIIVGKNTFSAAEDFAYAMQQLKRATIVGETTGGGAHMGTGIQRLTNLFTVFIPSGRSLNPITKTNWENIGVIPDVKVADENALKAAHMMSLRHLIITEKDAYWLTKLKHVLEVLTKQ